MPPRRLLALVLLVWALGGCDRGESEAPEVALLGASTEEQLRAASFGVTDEAVIETVQDAANGGPQSLPVTSMGARVALSEGLADAVADVVIASAGQDEVQATGLEVLVAAPTLSAQQALVRALDDAALRAGPAWSGQVQVLGHVQHPSDELVAWLHGELHQGDPASRDGVLRALGRLATHDEPTVRRAVLRAISEGGLEGAEVTVLRSLVEREDVTREELLAAADLLLSQPELPGAPETLRLLFRHPDLQLEAKLRIAEAIDAVSPESVDRPASP